MARCATGRHTRDTDMTDTVNIAPTLNGYRQILCALERTDTPVANAMGEVRAYLAAVDSEWLAAHDAEVAAPPAHKLRGLFAEFENELDQLVSDVVATLEYSPYSWTHAIRVPEVTGLTFPGDRFVVAGYMIVVMDDPDVDGHVRSKRVTVADLLGGIRRVCADNHLAVDAEAAGEIDADRADVALQYAVYGDVIFC